MTLSMLKSNLTSLLEKGDVDSLVAFLKAEEHFSFLKTKGLIFYSTSSSNNENDFLYRCVASSFIEYAKEAGAGKAFEDILKFLNCQEIPGHFVLAISGITIDTKKIIDENKGIILIPAKDIPDSCQKANYLPEYIDKDFILPREGMPLEILIRTNHPTSLVTKDGKIRPTAALVCACPMPKQDLGLDKGREIRSELLAICSYLTLIGPSSPNPVSFWWQPEPWLYCWPNSSGGWTQENFDIINVTAAPCAINDSELQLCRIFLSLPESLRNTFLTPLNRLNYALLRKSIVDRVIELGIAIESLFINDNQKNELTYRLSIRAAFLLGDDNNRSEIADLFKKLYDHRSSAVHGGSLKNLAEIKRDLEKCIIYTIEAIRKLIKYSSEINKNKINLPQEFWRNFWEKLILGNMSRTLISSNTAEERAIQD